MHPNVSLPKVWNTNVNKTFKIDPVLASPKPSPTSDDKVVVRNGAEQDANGNWVQAWTEVDRFTEYTDNDGNVITVQAQKDALNAADNALEAANARITRDELLKATDFYALSDVTLSSEMATYRQLLRDVPEQDGFPNNISWPTKP